MDGFTTIFSKSTTNYLSGGAGRYLGYKGIRDAVVVETDLFLDVFEGDKGWNTCSFKKCMGKECDSNEKGSLQFDLPVSYSKCSREIYNIRIVVENGIMKEFFNGKFVGEMPFNSDEFDGSAWLGFTGSFKGKKRDLKFYNSFICEDDYQNFDLTWEQSGTSTFAGAAGLRTRIDVVPKNVKGEVVKASKIENPALRAQTTCGNIGKIGLTNNETFSVEVMDCNVAGDHKVTLFSAKGQNQNVASLKVTANGFTKTQCVDATEVKDGKNWIRGGASKGKYILGSLRCKFSAKDNFGNASTKDLCKILNYSVFSPSNKQESAKCTESAGEYLLEINAKEVGTYRIQINAPEKIEYNLEVIPGTPNVQNSLFAIGGAKVSPKVEAGSTIKSICKIADSLNNSLRGIDVNQIYSGEFKCKVTLKNIQGQTSSLDGSVTPTDEGFECAVVAKEPGVYTLSGYLQISGGVASLVPSGVNSFTATLSPTNVKNIQFFCPTKGDWVSNKEVTFKLSSPYLTLIDFLTDDKQSLGSLNGKYLSDNFDVSKVLKGEIYALDSASYSSKLTIEPFDLNGNRYFAVKVDPTYIKKTTDGYNCDFTMNKQVTQLKINTPTVNTNGERVCIFDLKPENCDFFPALNLPMITTNCGQKTQVGELCLRDEKRCLYNHFIPDEKLASNMDGITFDKQEVEGMYTININTKIAGTNYLEATVDGYDVVGGYPITVQPEPIIAVKKIKPSKANSFISNNINTLQDQSGDDPCVKYYFGGCDARDNELDLNPARYNKYLGLNLNIKINGEAHLSSFNSQSSVIYDRRLRQYYTTECYNTPGKYEVTLSGRDGESFTYAYLKTPGKTNLQKSKCGVTTPEEVKVGEKVSFNVNLNDSNNFGIEMHIPLLNEELKKVKCSAISEDDSNIVDLSYSKVDGSNCVFNSGPMAVSTKFRIACTYDSRPLQCTERCQFKVNYGDINVDNTKSSIILSSTAPMSSLASTMIDNIKTVPLFSAKFHDVLGNWIAQIDTTKEKVTVALKGARFNIDLETSWINSNELHCAIPASRIKDFNDAVSTSVYSLEFTYKDKTKAFPLKFKGDGEDADAGNGDYTIDNTVVDNNGKVTLIAGETVEQRVEFRTLDNLRYNKAVDLSKCEIQAGTPDKTLKTALYAGNKKGTMRVSITSTTQTYPFTNFLTIVCDGKKVPIRIELTVKCSTLAKCYFDANSVSDAASKTLVQTTSVNPALVTLVCYDRFGNLFYPIFDEVAYSSDRCINLFNYSHDQGENVYVSIEKNKPLNNFALNIKCRKTGKITITSQFLDGTYSLNVTPGPIDSSNSYASVENSNLYAGDKAACEIHPHDKYGNRASIDNDSAANFNCQSLQIKPSEFKVPLKEEKKDEKNSIITAAGKIERSGDHAVQCAFKGEPLRTDNANLQVRVGPLLWKSSRLSMITTDKDVSCSDKTPTTVKQGVFNTWKLDCYDSFSNRYTKADFDRIQGVTYKATFSGNKLDVLLCTELINGQIQIQVCPDAKGRNEFSYIVPGSGYALNISMISTDKTPKLPETVSFPMTVSSEVPCDNCSNDDWSINHTRFSTKKVETVAGHAGKFNFILMTEEEKRRPLWFLKTEDSIKVIIAKPEGIKYEVNHGSVPGEYEVVLTSTKAYSASSKNTVQISIEGQKCTQTIVDYVVKPEVPLRAEIRDTENKKLDSLPEGNCDVQFKFNLALFDKYENLCEVEPEDINYTTKNPSGNKFSSTITKNSDNSFRVTINPKIAGIWNFECALVSKNAIPFNVYPGDISNVNSLVFSPNKINAGDRFSVQVTLFDAYGNVVDARTQSFNPVEIMHKNVIVPGKYSNYEPVDKDACKFTFEKNVNNFRNFNKPVEAVKEFYLVNTADNLVYIRTKTGKKCLKSEKDRLTVTNDCAQSQALTIKPCKETSTNNVKFFVIETADKTCITDTVQGFGQAKCDCNDVKQAFMITKNLDHTFYFQCKKENLAWTLNDKNEIVEEGLQGGSPQVFLVDSVVPQQGVFSAPGGKADEIGVLKYDVQVEKASEYVFRAVVDGKDCKCENCVTTVAPAAEDFSHTLLKRFTSKNIFEEMNPTFTEDNTKVDPIYQCHPRDKFDNLIGSCTKNAYSAYLEDKDGLRYKLKISDNKSTEFCEFVKNDDEGINKNKYENLVQGVYTLNVCKTGETCQKKIVNLLGTASDSDASNADIDLAACQIREQRVGNDMIDGKVVPLFAGETGKLMIELLNKDGRRHNSWGHKVTLDSTSLADKFVFDVKNAGKKGVYLCTFSTDKANDYPVYQGGPAHENIITIEINGVKCKASVPLKIKPADMDTCDVVLPDRLGETDLRSGNADTPLSFQVACFDKYQNTCSALTNKVNLVVTDASNVEVSTTNTLDRITNLAKYTSLTRTAGIFTIKADPKYFKKTYKYKNDSGVLVRENVLIIPSKATIIAGETAEVVVKGRDQWKNIIPPTRIASRFNAKITTDMDNEVECVSEVKNDSIVYRALLTERDDSKVGVQVDKKELGNRANILVKPAKVYLKKSAFSSSNLGNDVPDGTITKTNKYLTSAQIYFRDIFSNFVDEVDTKTLTVSDCKIVGHNTLPITLTASLSITEDSFELKITDYKSIRAYSRLCAGNGYSFTCTLKYGEQTETFNYPLNIISARDDTGRGNGPLVAAKTEVGASKLAIVAGNCDTVDITLKQSEGKIFNDGCNTAETFKYTLKTEDKNHKVEIFKKSPAAGIYSLEFCSTTVLLEDQVISLFVKEDGAKEFTELKGQEVTVTVLPKLPPRDTTKFIEKPSSEHPAGSPVKFRFTLEDQHGNQFVNFPQILNDLVLMNGPSVVESKRSLEEDGKTYVIEATVDYSISRKASLQILYKTATKVSQVNNEAIDVEFVSSLYSLQNSVVKGNTDKREAGSKLDVAVWLYDANKTCMDTKSNVLARAEIVSEDKDIIFKGSCNLKKVQNPTLHQCIESYNSDCDAENTPSKVGVYTLTIYLDNIKKESYKHIIYSGPQVNENFTLVNDSANLNFAKLPAGTIFNMHIKSYDALKNQFTDQAGNVASIGCSSDLRVKVNDQAGVAIANEDRTVAYSEKPVGTCNITVSISKAGTFYIALLKKNSKDVMEEIVNIDRSNSPAKLEVIPIDCSGNFKEYTGKFSATMDADNTITYTCFDKYGNKHTRGGANVVPKVTRTKSNKEVTSQQHDNADGTYTLSFVPTFEDTYTVSILVNEKEVYGNSPLVVKVDNPPCDKQRCPNKPSKCVGNLSECQDTKGVKCPPETPFWGKIGKEENCLVHQTDIDCPEGQVKGTTQPFCVNKEIINDVCPTLATGKCGDLYECNDGICRANRNQCPSTYACPVGLTLCPELTCVNLAAGEECRKDLPVCAKNQIRCNDLTCADNVAKCPTMITCSNIDFVVCPDKSCQKSELLCKAKDACPLSSPFRCSNGDCAPEASKCTSGIVCKVGQCLGEGQKCQDVCNTQDVVAVELTAEEIARLMKPKFEEEERVRIMIQDKNESLRKDEDAKLRLVAIHEKNRLEDEKIKKEEEERVAIENARIAKALEEAKKEEARVRAQKEEQLRKDKLAEEARNRAALELQERKKAEALRVENERIAQEKEQQTKTLRANLLNGPLKNMPWYSTLGTQCKEGQSLKLLHLNTRNSLHSHGINWCGGSRQQEMTCYGARDDNDWFRPTSLSKNGVQNGSKIALTHNLTGKSIYADARNRAPMTGQTELSARPLNTNDQQFCWNLEIHSSWANQDSNLRVGDTIKLINCGNGTSLHSHGININCGSRQQETTGYGVRDSNDYWVVVQCQ